MEILLESVREDWEALLQVAPRLVLALLLLGLFVAAGRAIGAGLARLARRSSRTREYERPLRQLSRWGLGFAGLLLALQAAGLGRVAAGLLAAGGVMAVVFGFAFREIGENLLAGFFLSFSRTFEMGDLIQSGEWVGAVRGIQLRHVHIRTADGRDIFIPTADIFRRALVNFTRDGLRRPSFTVGIDYADDADKARRVLLEAVRSVEGVLKDPPPSVHLSALAPQWVELEVGFWSDTFQQGLELLEVRSVVMDRCRRVLLENGFTPSSSVTSNVQVRGASSSGRA